jgi:hypothetical protein
VFGPLLHSRILFPSRVTIDALIHPNETLLVELNCDNVGCSRPRSRGAVGVWAHDVCEVVQGRIVFQVGIHNESRRLIFTKRVLIHNWILSLNRFLVFALATTLNSGLYPVDDFLINRIEHVSASRTELHSLLVIWTMLYKFVLPFVQNGKYAK